MILGFHGFWFWRLHDAVVLEFPRIPMLTRYLTLYTVIGWFSWRNSGPPKLSVSAARGEEANEDGESEEKG